MKNLKTFSCLGQQVPRRCLVGFPPLFSPNLYFFPKLHLSLSLGTDGPRKGGRKASSHDCPRGPPRRGELVPSRGHGGQAFPLDGRGGSRGLTLLCSL